MPFSSVTEKTLLQHSGTQRQPTTQREWNAFLQSLDIYLLGETDAFTPTFTGFSSDPVAAVVYWKKVGSLVHLGFTNASRGTSDTNVFAITNLPERIQPTSLGVDVTVPIIGIVDNGVESWGTANVTSNGIINFGFETTSATSWLGSGSKGFNTRGSSDPYIIYDTKFISEEV